MSKPTPQQQAVIDATIPRMKVSANAGSGKTYTIMQRIARIIELGKKQPQQSVSLDQLLVLTFTEASALDMRKKLKKQLGDLVSPVELQSATIGTFHSFCANIVRAWFTVAEVSPSFTVMDALESEKIKTSIFEQVVLENYSDLHHAVDLFTAGSRSLDELRKTVFTIHNFLASREDQTQWLKTTALAAYETDIDKNPAVQALIDDYHDVASKYREHFITTGEPSPALDLLVNLANKIISAKTYLEFSRLDLTVPNAGSSLKGQSDAFKKLREKFRDNVCKVIQEQFKYPVAQIQADINADRQVVDELIKLVVAFDEAYQAKKTEYKKLDFNDLEKYALKVLANPDAMASIRAQFKYIFVDEGQDTNPVQFKIINLLRGDDKFFCIVGDVKQSIYGFRDCEPELFDQLKDQNGDLVPVLLLGKNFRSTDPILHFVNLVMQPLIANYTSEHQFTALGQSNLAEMKASVTMEAGKDLDAQMELVYRQIIQARTAQVTIEKEVNGKNVKQRVPVMEHGWQDIAVLAETNDPLEHLQKYLTARGIPCVIQSKADALQEPVVALLNHFLAAAMNPTNALARYIVLQHLFNYTNDELAHLRLEKISPALKAKVTRCDQVLAKYRQLSRAQSAYEVLTQVATEFGMLELPVVNAFLTAIRGVRDFDTVARYLYLVEHQLVKIEIDVGAENQNAVKLMTIHHSKGLEFPMVILFNLGASWSKQGGQGHKISLDKNMGICVVSVDTENYVRKSPVLRLGIKKYQDARNVQEKIRLLYVALTRAQKKLALIGSWQRNPYLIRPDCLFDLVNQLNVVTYDEVPVSATQTSDEQKTAPSLVTCPLVGQPDVLVKQSVTALATVAEPFQDYIAPNRFADQGGKEFGTAFHRQVQYGNLPKAVQDLVTGYTVYRELPFLYLQNQTIVQGIMDLLAVKEHEAIIVDYKTTRLPKESLIAKYQEQLRLYAQAIPGYRVRTYIYSTVHQTLIEVSL